LLILQPREQWLYIGGAIKHLILSVVMGALLAFCCYQSCRRLRAGFLPEWFAIVTLTLLPFLAVAIAYWGVGTYAPRHCVECIAGMVMLLAVTLSGWLEKIPARTGAWMAVVCVPLGAFAVAHQQRNLRAADKDFLAQEQAPEALLRAIRKNPSQLIYLTEPCLNVAQNVPPEVLSHLRCLASKEQMLRYIWLSWEALGEHTDFPVRIVTYESFRQDLPAYYVTTGQTWEQWIPDALAADGATTTLMGSGLAGKIYIVSAPHNNATSKTEVKTNSSRAGNVP
jgi:hypothetical protein